MPNNQENFQSSIVDHYKSLKHSALFLTRNKEDAEDLVQEAICNALSNQEKFIPGSNIGAWLYTIMKNAFVNNYRKKKTSWKSTVDVENLKDITCNTTILSDAGEESAEMGKLSEIIGGLDERFRLAFVMHYEGYKYQEIATITHAPLGTAKSRVFTAKQILQKKILRY